MQVGEEYQEKDDNFDVQVQGPCHPISAVQTTGLVSSESGRGFFPGRVPVCGLGVFSGCRALNPDLLALRLVLEVT